MVIFWAIVILIAVLATIFAALLLAAWFIGIRWLKKLRIL